MKTETETTVEFLMKMYREAVEKNPEKDGHTFSYIAHYPTPEYFKFHTMETPQQWHNEQKALFEKAAEHLQSINWDAKVSAINNKVLIAYRPKQAGRYTYLELTVCN